MQRAKDQFQTIEGRCLSLKEKKLPKCRVKGRESSSLMGRRWEMVERREKE
jgi:hypothetical protein